MARKEISALFFEKTANKVDGQAEKKYNIKCTKCANLAYLFQICRIRPGGENMKYEMLYLIDSSIAEDAREALIAKFEGLVASLGGKVLSTDKWGVKKLAYPIDYKSDAFYVLMTFEADGSSIKELDRDCGITDGVLRRMITKAN